MWQNRWQTGCQTDNESMKKLASEKTDRLPNRHGQECSEDVPEISYVLQTFMMETWNVLWMSSRMFLVFSKLSGIFCSLQWLSLIFFRPSDTNTKNFLQRLAYMFFRISDTNARNFLIFIQIFCLVLYYTTYCMYIVQHFRDQFKDTDAGAKL